MLPFDANKAEEGEKGSREAVGLAGDRSQDKMGMTRWHGGIHAHRAPRLHAWSPH